MMVYYKDSWLFNQLGFLQGLQQRKYCTVNEMVRGGINSFIHCMRVLEQKENTKHAGKGFSADSI